VIDFVNVTGAKIFYCSVHGANCNSMQFSAPEVEPSERTGTHRAALCAGPSDGKQFASQACRTVYFWFVLV
jgi:hypothetical protein